MRWQTEVWREKPWVWILPAVFLLVQILALVVYQVRYAGGVETLERTYAREAEALATLQEQRARGETLMARAVREREELSALYEIRFATEAERHTDFLKEVRKLARDAGMDPLSFSYPKETLEDQGLVKFDVQFTIQGTYEELRSFMNLLELTDQFVILESVGLGSASQTAGRQDPTLSITVDLSTYYRDPSVNAAESSGGTT